MSVRRLKGSGMLLFVVISIAVSAALAVGLSKMNEQNFRTAVVSGEHMQARHHAQERADIIRASSFASLSGMPKTVIGGVGASGEPFYEEVIESKSGIYKDYTINIYKGLNDKVLFSLVVHRADPKVLINSTAVDSMDTNSQDTSMTAYASQELLSSKIGAGVDSVSNDSSMSAKVLKDYVANQLNNYNLKESIVLRPEGEAVGTAMHPVYVASDGYVKVTNSNYRFNENVSPVYIGTMTIDSSGNFKVDYMNKSDFLAQGNP